MYHILISGKYYLLSVAAHCIFITLLSVFTPMSMGNNSLPAQEGAEKILRVSFNKNNSVSLQSNLQQHAAEKNIIDNESQPNRIDKNYQEVYDINSESSEKEFFGEPGIMREEYASANTGTSFFKKAYLLAEITPLYPTYAIKKGIEGTVLLDVDIDSSGKVSKTEIVVSSNYDILDKAAIRSVKKARFTPASYMGKPSPDTLRIAINFYLEE